MAPPSGAAAHRTAARPPGRRRRTRLHVGLAGPRRQAAPGWRTASGWQRSMAPEWPEGERRRSPSAPRGVARSESGALLDRPKIRAGGLARRQAAERGSRAAGRAQGATLPRTAGQHKGMTLHTGVAGIHQPLTHLGARFCGPARKFGLHSRVGGCGGWRKSWHRNGERMGWEPEVSPPFDPRTTWRCAEFPQEAACSPHAHPSGSNK